MHGLCGVNMEKRSISSERTKVLDIICKVVDLVANLMMVFGLR